MQGWDCVLVEQSCAEALGDLIQADTGRATTYYREPCLSLPTPATAFDHPAVQLLTPNHAALIANAPARQMRGEGWPSADHLLADGIAAGAIIEDKLVALASTCARSERHAEIQIYTLEDWRGRGLATAAASLVARRIQESGQTPVWMAG